MKRRTPSASAALAMALASAASAAPAGDATRGEQLFGACAACHAVAADRNMTGPSLAGVWGRKAGGLKSFERYSPALKASAVVWDGKTLDAWLKSPSRLIPGNRMTFAGISNVQQRADLIAFLKEASAGNNAAQAAAEAMAPPAEDLKKLGPDHQVAAIRYCRDTYHVRTADGRSGDFWERNLRLKTDSSAAGPRAGQPVILPAGMMGDRASVFFASPEDIGAFVKHQCDTATGAEP